MLFGTECNSHQLAIERIHGGSAEPPKPGCSGTSNSYRSASASKNGSHCGTPPAPCRNSTVGPRPARCSLIGTFRTVSSLTCAGIRASSLLAVRDSEPVAALDLERHGVKIMPVGVEVFQVNEQAFVVDEMRPGMPGRDV